MDYSEGQQAARRRESGVDRIGSYSLIAQIAAGDFTTVHLAQRQGTLGYQRLTAIKRLKPSLARQPEWTQLLLDEARLSAGVRHGNIVDIIDVGTDPDSGVYLVMGYVEGADLEVLIARAGKERHPRYLVPPIVDALMGLSAVHTALECLRTFGIDMPGAAHPRRHRWHRENHGLQSGLGTWAHPLYAARQAAGYGLHGA